MNCPNCNKPVEPGAAFCGNCGQTLQTAPQPVQPQPIAPVQQPAPTPVVAPMPAPSPIAQVYNNQLATNPQAPAPFVPAPAAGGMPAYAVAAPGQHAGETKALLSVILGVISIFLGLIPIVGVILGIVGVVLGTTARSSHKRGLSTAGIILSCFGIVVSIAIFTYVLANPNAFGHTSSHKTADDPALNGTASTAASASTPCYTVSFIDKLNIKNTDGSCDMSAFEGATIDESNNAYKIYGTKSTTLNADNFQSFAKQAIDQDVQSNLAGFAIVSEQADKFAGSQAYVVKTTDKASGISVVEAAVLHPVANGDNVFVLAHAVQGDTADFKALEAQWQWK